MSSAITLSWAAVGDCAVSSSGSTRQTEDLMNRRFFRSGVVFHTVVLIAIGTLTGAEPSWQAGFAKAKITPEPGLWMAGYAARDHAAEGTMHDLWVKALALADNDGHKGVLVSLDLLGLPESMYANVCSKAKKQCGLDASQIMLCASHTHCGPVLRGALYDIYPMDDDQRARIEKYSSTLEDILVETITKALAQMKPAKLAVGASETSFAANRRALRTGATGAAAPVDHVVPVMTVRSSEDDLQTIVFGYACHATTLMAYQWNGDYPGFAQLALEEKYPGVEAMFIAGCGADQNPNPRRTVELCQQHGQALADAVCDALDNPMEPIAPEIRTAISLIELPYGEQPGDEYLEKTAKGTNYAARWAGRLLKQKQTGKPFAKSYPTYPVQAWRLGNYQLVALGGEVVVDYVLALREKLGPNVWVAAYTNDVMAYIPSSRVRAEGGYEAGAFSVYGLPAMSWSADVEQRVVGAAEKLSEQLTTAAAQ